MEKQLVVGQNYGECFGLDPEKGMFLIYQGGVSFLARKPGGEKVIESKDTAEKALEYINRPSVHMGM